MKTMVIESSNPGPTIAIIGGTHGNEICGVQLINYLQSHLVIQRGKVILLYGNLRAIEQCVRQVGMDLNRSFLEDSKLTEAQKNTYEYIRSREMMEILKDCDYLLDIHSSPTIGSPPMVICERNDLEVASYFPFSIRCSWFDTIAPGSTGCYMNSRGKIGLGVECGNHNDPEALYRAKESAYAFLSYFGFIDHPKRKYDQIVYTVKSSYLTRTNDFRVSQFFADFDSIERGQLIGTDAWNPIYAQNNGYILFARDRNEVGVEGFVELVG